MNVIITGGNGFLGSNLVRKLLKHKHNIYVLSRNNYNLTDILSDIKFDFCENKDISLYSESIRNFQPDVVLHFGWSGGNNYNDVNSILQFENNVQYSIQLINILKDLPKLPKFIGVGSFAEYGIQTKLISESTNENPANLYGLSKLTFKKYSEILCKLYNIDWVWLRPCYVYGPGDVSTRLIPTTINKFLNHEPINLDKCDTIIDYIYVDDFTKFVYELLLSDNIGVYNICSGIEYELKYIISKIRSLTNSKSIIKFDNIDKKTSVSKYICGDNTKVKNATNMHKTTDLETGLITTINFYKHEASSNN